jgi:hypothetical protein
VLRLTLTFLWLGDFPLAWRLFNPNLRFILIRLIGRFYERCAVLSIVQHCQLGVDCGALARGL